MIEVLLQGIMMRKLRTVLTAFGVIFGVAMISGTFVLTDTIMSAYNTIFTTAYVHTDAVVVAKAPFGVVGTTKETVSATVLQRIRALPEVARAHGYIDAHAQLVDARGQVIGGSGETLLFGIPTGELDAMNPLSLLSGTWPTGPHDIVIDEATARNQHLGVGTTVGLVARKPLAQYRVVGIFRFGGATTLGPSQMLAVDLGVAQRIYDKQGMFDEIDVARRPGVTTATLVRAINQVLPSTARVTTATAQVQDATSQVGQQYLLLQYVLLAFGGVALLVASFIIFNTQSITVAQRMRELATLRALGASHRQVLASILLEGAIIGAVGSAIGLGVGIGFAKGLNALFAASKIHLPGAGLVFSWRTVLIGLGAGLVFTIGASVPPALRAMRIPPIAAFRQDSALASHRRTHKAQLGIISAGIAGVAALVSAAVAGDLSTSVRLLLLACGALLVFLALGVSRAGWCRRWPRPSSGPCSPSAMPRLISPATTRSELPDGPRPPRPRSPSASP